jgi:hypothetical protein
MFFQLETKVEQTFAEDPGAPENSLFQPDTLLPDQYFESIRRNIRQDAEKKLMLAILEDAIVSFQKYYFTGKGHEKELFAEAKKWIIEEKDDCLFSFTSICEFLEINPDYLRRGLLQWKERQISLLQLHKGKEVRWHEEGSGLRYGRGREESCGDFRL